MIRSRLKMPEPIHLAIEPPEPANPEFGLKGFEAEVAVVVRAFRKALTQVVEALPGDNRRPADLQKSLKLDWKLCWQISNVVRFTDAMAIAPHIPTLASIKRFSTATESAGVSPSLTTDVVSTCQQFDEMVAMHAADRAEFDLMAASIFPGENSAAAELANRRSAYRAQSHIWGFQQDVMTVTAIVRGSPEGDVTDECDLNQKLGMRRLRAGAPMRVFGIRRLPTSQTDSFVSRRPLEPAAADVYGAPLLPDFCSNPLPKFDVIPASDGWNHFNLRSDAIGRRSAVNLAFGDVSFGIPLAAKAEGSRQFQHGGLLTVPTRLKIFTLMVHRPSFGVVSPGCLTFRPASGEGGIENIAALGFQLPMREQVEMIGSGADAAATPDVPRYPSLIEHACRILSWDADEFDVYRLRIEYPVLDTVVRVYFDVP